MDIKTALCYNRYMEVTGFAIMPEQFDSVLRSKSYLLGKPGECEFRTTVCSKFVSKKDLVAIAKSLDENAVYVLQPYTTHQTLSQKLADEKYVVPYETLVKWSEELGKFVANCIVREV